MTDQAGSLLALLAQLAVNVKDRYYKNQIIYLDGYTFTNCCFHNCQLVTHTGTFSLTSCALLNCRIQYGPNAVRIIRMWNTHNTNLMWPDFNPKVDPDGAITIE